MRRYHGLVLFRLGALAIAGLISACTAIITSPEESDPEESEPEETPHPTALIVRIESGCVEARPPGDAKALLTSDPGDRIVVAEVFFASEQCTDLGGDYLLARELDEWATTHWLGGHGCRFSANLMSASGQRFGVLRVSQTAGIFQVAAGACVGFPNAEFGLRTSTIGKAAALFNTEADARAFASTL